MKILRKISRILFSLILCVQMIYGIFWIVRCGLSMPDTTENSFYLEAAKALRFDEYTGVMYPVFLRFLYLPFSEKVGRLVVAFFQLVAVAGSGWFFLGMFEKKISGIVKAGAVAYTVSFPVVMHIIFQTLPEAFAVSLFLVWARLLLSKDRGARINVVLVALYVVMGFMSLRYAYIIGFLWLVYLLVVYRQKFFNNIACIITGAVFIIILNLVLVDAGAYGRMPATLSTGLMCNYAFEAFEADYYFWPQSAKEAIPFEEIKPYRAYREHVVTEMGQPFLDSMTYFKADMTALGVAKASIMNRSKETVTRFFDNCSFYLLTPITFLENVVGDGRSVTPRNLYSFGGDDWGFALEYMYISLIMCSVLAIALGIRGLIRRVNSERSYIGAFFIVTYLTLTVLYALFAFSYFDYLLMAPVILMGLMLLVTKLIDYVQQPDKA